MFPRCALGRQLVKRFQRLTPPPLSSPFSIPNGVCSTCERSTSAILIPHRLDILPLASPDISAPLQATVGAGLPIISTLQGLVATGDGVKRIEGVLSGTLSFIFNTFGPGRSFSSVVTEAKSAGYTEPDPREDLSGTPSTSKRVRGLHPCLATLPGRTCPPRRVPHAISPPLWACVCHVENLRLFEDVVSWDRRWVRGGGGGS